MKYLGIWQPITAWSRDSSYFIVALPSMDAPKTTDYTVKGPVTLWKIAMSEPKPHEVGEFTARISDITYSPDLQRVGFGGFHSVDILDLSGSVQTIPLPKESTGMSFGSWAPDSRHYTYGVGTGSDEGYQVIADLCDPDFKIEVGTDFQIVLYPQFGAWLDAKHYLFFDYQPPTDGSGIKVDLVLSDLNGEEERWPVDFPPEGVVLAIWSTP
jgi:hypothetical protein